MIMLVSLAVANPVYASDFSADNVDTDELNSLRTTLYLSVSGEDIYDSGNFYNNRSILPGVSYTFKYYVSKPASLWFGGVYSVNLSTGYHETTLTIPFGYASSFNSWWFVFTDTSSTGTYFLYITK